MTTPHQRRRAAVAAQRLAAQQARQDELRKLAEGSGRRDARILPRGPIRVFEADTQSASESPTPPADCFSARYCDVDFDVSEDWTAGPTFTTLASADGERHRVYSPVFINAGERFLATFDDRRQRWHFLRGYWRSRFMAIAGFSDTAGHIPSGYAVTGTAGQSELGITGQVRLAEWNDVTRQWEPTDETCTVTNADSFPIPFQQLVEVKRDDHNGRYLATCRHHAARSRAFYETNLADSLAKPFLLLARDAFAVALTSETIWTPSLDSQPPEFRVTRYARPWFRNVDSEAGGSPAFDFPGTFKVSGQITIRNIGDGNVGDLELRLSGFSGRLITNLVRVPGDELTDPGYVTRPLNALVEALAGDWPSLSADSLGWPPSPGGAGTPLTRFALGYHLLIEPLHD